MPTTPPLVAKIFDTASRRPEKEAVVIGGRSISYRGLKAGIEAAAGLLAERGVRRGDRVLLAASSREPSFVFGYFACHALGAIAVPVDPRAGETVLADIARQTRPRLACLGPGELAGGEPAAPLELAAADPDAPADILFTSGTTGRPKGVQQSFRNILAFASGRNAAVGSGEDDRLVLPLPLSHGFGLGRLRSVMLGGGTVILVDGFRFPGAVFQAFDEHRGSSLCCVPAGFAALFRLSGDELGAYRDRLRYVESATAPLPDEQKARLMRLLPATRLFNSYGLTETTSSVAFIDLNAEPDKRASVGRPVPGVEFKIVDRRRRPLPAGETGRILIRGENVMRGYWKDAKRTRQVLKGGWYAANDLGFLDADGFLHLGGRPEELINVGGLKLAPVELEQVLRTHPAVGDCAVVGFEDPAGLTGEAVRAFLVAAPGAPAKPSDGELAAWLAGRVEPYKIPTSFVWLAELPRTPLGKVRRALLKERRGGAQG